jgi:hypothetical protein
MDWTAFWSAMVGAIPATLISMFSLLVQTRSAQALELVKTQLQQDVFKFSKWHERRVDALLKIFEAFVDYLDFMRRKLYFENNKESLDPMHEFNDTVERQLVYLDDTMAEKVLRYRGELLIFWNSSILNVASEEVRHRLDYEIPVMLRKLREDINRFADPNFQIDSDALVLHHGRKAQDGARMSFWDSIGA